ncbi:hypothetical protein C0J52_28369 [Blattella germanica]|nr:hypothetical protein C0J52_28369 [Blattella germanica]
MARFIFYFCKCRFESQPFRSTNSVNIAWNEEVVQLTANRLRSRQEELEREVMKVNLRNGGKIDKWKDGEENMAVVQKRLSFFSAKAI